jgi:hypothetical protein
LAEAPIPGAFNVTDDRRRSIMPKSRYALIFALALMALATDVAPTLAQAGSTPEQRAACRPDVVRLCSDHIPYVQRIIACMRRNQARLSPACAAVFDK